MLDHLITTLHKNRMTFGLTGEENDVTSITKRSVVQRLKRRNTHDRTVLSFLWQVKIVAVFPGISMLISVWIGTKIDPEFEEDIDRELE